MKRICFILIFIFLFANNLFAQQQLTVDKEIKFLLSNPNRIENIPRILKLMCQDGIWDVNKDGLINCIDYSVVFRILYGSNARIIINKNPVNGMNHMFIRVWYNVDTEYIDVEPQGTPDRYSMGLIWGVKYNYIHNRDVTNQWTHVVEGMY